MPLSEDSDSDDYGPALPPHLAAARAETRPEAISQAPPRRTIGPSFPQQSARYDSDSSDDGVGPKPSAAPLVESDGVAEFLESEQRRKDDLEGVGKSKALKREEWMLAPPSSSDLLGSLDPKKLRQTKKTFSAATSTSRDTKIDNTLWTETPAERQKRLAEEMSGKRKRATNDNAEISQEEAAEKRRKVLADEEMRRKVDEYNKTSRGKALVDVHASKIAKEKKDEESPGIWDHTRDMSLGGRLMDDQKRNQMIAEAKGLSDRFGSGKGGSFI